MCTEVVDGGDRRDPPVSAVGRQPLPMPGPSVVGGLVIFLRVIIILSVDNFIIIIISPCVFFLFLSLLLQ